MDSHTHELHNLLMELIRLTGMLQLDRAIPDSRSRVAGLRTTGRHVCPALSGRAARLGLDKSTVSRLVADLGRPGGQERDPASHRLYRLHYRRRACSAPAPGHRLPRLLPALGGGDPEERAALLTGLPAWYARSANARSPGSLPGRWTRWLTSVPPAFLGLGLRRLARRPRHRAAAEAGGITRPGRDGRSTSRATRMNTSTYPASSAVATPPPSTVFTPGVPPTSPSVKPPSAPAREPAAVPGSTSVTASTGPSRLATPRSRFSTTRAHTRPSPTESAGPRTSVLQHRPPYIPPISVRHRPSGQCRAAGQCTAATRPPPSATLPRPAPGWRASAPPGSARARRSRSGR